MIAYKVVQEGKRISRVIGHSRSIFVLKYKKGETVQAPEGTAGIFCFKRKKDAEDWAFGTMSRFGEYEIIKVKGKGKPCYPEYILPHSYTRKFRFWKKYGVYYPPQGTVCFPAVKVLE